MAQSPKSLDFGLWALDLGLGVMDFAFSDLSLGLWALGFGLRVWTLDFTLELFGFWIVHLGFCTLGFGLWM